MKKTITLVLVVILSTTIFAQNQVISLNYYGLSTQMAAATSAGLIPVANWNNIKSNGSSWGGTALLATINNSQGTQLFNDVLPTTFDCKWIGSNYKTGDDLVANTSGDYQMMSGYAGRDATTESEIKVYNLPASFLANGFDVYVYWGNQAYAGDRDNAPRYTICNSAGTKIGSYRFIWDTTPNAFEGSYIKSKATLFTDVATVGGIADGNYVVFDSLYQDVCYLKMKNNSSTTLRGGISGFQIVERIPTPANVLVNEVDIFKNSFTINWSASTRVAPVNSNDVSYLVSVYTKDIANVKTYIKKDIAITNTSYEVTGLDPATVYYYTINAKDTYTLSKISAEASVTTKDVGTSLEKNQLSSVFINNQKIIVPASGNQIIDIYTVTGAKAKSITTAQDKNFNLNLESGIYLVKVKGVNAQRIVVR